MASASLTWRWTRATFGGWCLGFVLLLVFIALSSGIGLGSTQFPIGLGMGMGVGLVQRRIIADQVGAGRQWWRATTIGLTAPFVVWDGAQLVGIAVPQALALCVVAGGLVVGVLQWRLLRSRFARSGWWIPASLLGWAMAGTMVVINDRVMPKIPGIAGALLYIAVVLAGGLPLGLVTGVTLGRMVERPAG